MTHILYIEDDFAIGAWLKENLEKKHGYKVMWVKNGEDAVDLLDDINLVILDLMLEGIDGFTIGKRIKEKNKNLPILILSARTSLEDKLEGLAFADDYITKPFHPDELSARIEVLTRRFQNIKKYLWNRNSIEVNLSEGLVIHHDSNKIFHLTGKEILLLEFFLQNPNQILTKKQLYNNVWGEPEIGIDNTIMVHIRHLRKKIEKDPNNPNIIQTIRGIGYKVVI